MHTGAACTDMYETLSPENQNRVSVAASLCQSELVPRKTLPYTHFCAQTHTESEFDADREQLFIFRESAMTWIRGAVVGGLFFFLAGLFFCPTPSYFKQHLHLFYFRSSCVVAQAVCFAPSCESSPLLETIRLFSLFLASADATILERVDKHN